jgi:hypothetical protein
MTHAYLPPALADAFEHEGLGAVTTRDTVFQSGAIGGPNFFDVLVIANTAANIVTISAPMATVARRLCRWRREESGPVAPVDGEPWRLFVKGPGGTVDLVFTADLTPEMLGPLLDAALSQTED